MTLRASARPFDTSINVKPSGDATGAKDQAAIAAAVAAGISLKKNVQLGIGDWYINDNIDISDGYRYSDSPVGSNNSVTVPNIYGAGLNLTRVTQVTAAKAHFRIYGPAGLSVVGFRMDGMTLIGPGTANAATVGIYLGGVSAANTNGIGSARLSNLKINDVATCIRMDDCTGCEFDNCVAENNTYGIELGYNCDLNTFEQFLFYGDIKTPVNKGTAVSGNTWAPPFNTRGSGNANVWFKCQFLLLTNCFDVEVNTTSQWVVCGYFERCNKIAKLGTASDTGGVKNFILDKNHFSQASTATFGLTSAAIEVLGTGAAVDPYIELSDNRSDTTPTQQWILGIAASNAGEVIWRGTNILNSSHANGIITWGGANVSVPVTGQADFTISQVRKGYYINSVLGATPANETQIRQGVAARIYQKFTPVDSAAAQAGSDLTVQNLDAAGAAQVVALTGFLVSRMQNSVARPAAAVAYRGGAPALASASGTPDFIEACVKDGADVYSWHPLLRWHYVNTTSVGNLGAGTDDLISISLPANSLNTTGRGVRIIATGTTANNANAKTLILSFGGTAILTNALTASVAGVWRLESTVWRTGSNTQKYNSSLVTTGTAGVALNDIEDGTAAITDTAAIVVKCTGAATTDNDIVNTSLSIEQIGI